MHRYIKLEAETFSGPIQLLYASDRKLFDVKRKYGCRSTGSPLSDTDTVRDARRELLQGAAAPRF